MELSGDMALHCDVPETVSRNLFCKWISNFLSNQFSEEREQLTRFKSLKELDMNWASKGRITHRSLVLIAFCLHFHGSIVSKWNIWALCRPESNFSIVGVLSVSDHKFIVASKTYKFCKTGHTFRALANVQLCISKILWAKKLRFYVETL